MSDPEARGATPQDWYHFDFELGLGANLLPCVPAGDDVRVLDGSALEGKVGKIPSVFNPQGFAHGLPAWQKRVIEPRELALWRKDPRLNICVRTGPISGVYAIDVDVDDENISPEIGQALYDGVANASRPPESPLYYRGRTGPSRKFLVPFRLEDGECKKRIIKTAAGRIELLADGQQFVAAGSHSSGARYHWQPGLPDQLPVLTLAQLDALWAGLTATFGSVSETSSPSKAAQTDSGSRSSSMSTELSASPISTLDDATWDELRSALRFLLPLVEDNDTWSEVGYALLSLKKPHDGKAVWIDFSRQAKGFVAGAPEQWWETHKSQPTRTDYRHIFTMARARGWGATSNPDIFQHVDNVEVGGAGATEEVSGHGGGGCEAVSDEGGTETAGDREDQSPVREEFQSEKRIVRIADEALVLNVRELSEILQPEVYTQGGNYLTRLSRDSIDDEYRKERGQPRLGQPIRLLSVSTEWARVRLMELALFMKRNPKAKKDDDPWKLCSPTPELMNVWAGQGEWVTLRAVDAIARAPFVRYDGSICDVAGYDSESRTLYMPEIEFPSIPSTPTIADARLALDGIRSIFDQFPWQTPASESAFLAHILTEAARLAVDRSPMFWYSAPNAGTGKSMLSEMAAMIVHGAEPPLRPWAQSGEEIRKALFASLLGGDRSILLDNVPTGAKVRSPELCAFITAAVWKDRKLGDSEMRSLVNKAVVSASGNNITPVGDLARRSLVIRLDANSERMKERRFKIVDLRQHVMANRAQLLIHALTIIKAYYATEGINAPVPLPSFERWSRLVREPLMWLELPDPCFTQSETDDETESLQHVFAKLVDHFGDREFTSTEVANLSGGIADSNGELTNLLLNSGCSEPSSGLKVGYWLRGERDKVSGGWKLVNVGSTKFGTKWKFKRLNEDLS